MMTLIIKRILLYAFPAVLIYFGSDRMGNIFELEDNETYELACLLSGIFISSVALPAWNEQKKKTIVQQKELIGFLIKDLRVNLNKELEKQFNIDDLNLNIRIFSSRKSVRCFIMRILNRQRVFYMKHYSALSSDNIENLNFIVWPEKKAQGLVGKAYLEKKLYYDFDITEDKSADLYKLFPGQIEVTNNTRFVIAAPIFNKGTRRVIAIVTFDSKKSVNLPNNSVWTGKIRETCKIIHKCSQFL